MRVLGEVRNIWRYPVKSLKAEPLAQTRIESNGIPGDRAEALFVQAGHAREGKTFRGKEHNLLHTTTKADAAAQMARERGVSVEVRRDEQQHFFDDKPISLIFDRWVNEVSAGLDEQLDPLRWRPNLYVAAAPDFTFREQDLLGESLLVGDAVLRVDSTIGRCVTTTYDIQTGEPDDRVLFYVAQRRANVMGVYCEVELAGTVRAGDPLRLRDR